MMSPTILTCLLGLMAVSVTARSIPELFSGPGPLTHGVTHPNGCQVVAFKCHRQLLTELQTGVQHQDNPEHSPDGEHLLPGGVPHFCAPSVVNCAEAAPSPTNPFVGPDWEKRGTLLYNRAFWGIQDVSTDPKHELVDYTVPWPRPTLIKDSSSGSRDSAANPAHELVDYTVPWPRPTLIKDSSSGSRNSAADHPTPKRALDRVSDEATVVGKVTPSVEDLMGSRLMHWDRRPKKDEINRNVIHKAGPWAYWPGQPVTAPPSRHTSGPMPVSRFRVPRPQHEHEYEHEPAPVPHRSIRLSISRWQEEEHEHGSVLLPNRPTRLPISRWPKEEHKHDSIAPLPPSASLPISQRPKEHHKKQLVAVPPFTPPQQDVYEKLP